MQTRHGPKKLVLVASAENNVYALDADTGADAYGNENSPQRCRLPRCQWHCPNNLNATPVIDKENGILYVLTNDGKLRGIGCADGEDRITPVELTEPYSRNWSLNLIDGLIYTAASRGCGPAISGIFATDVSKPDHPVYRFYTSTGKASGPWGRGGIVRVPTGVIAQTADGVYDPASGRFGNTFVSLTKDLRLTDSYTPANWEYLNRKDFDLGSASPTVFEFDKWTLAAAAAKEGVIYLLNAADLGGRDHHTPFYVSPRYGNDALTFGFNGVWGTLSTWVDAQGERWLLVPMLGPPAQDTVAHFKIATARSSTAASWLSRSRRKRQAGAGAQMDLPRSGSTGHAGRSQWRCLCTRHRRTRRGRPAIRKAAPAQRPAAPPQGIPRAQQSGERWRTRSRPRCCLASRATGAGRANAGPAIFRRQRANPRRPLRPRCRNRRRTLLEPGPDR